MKMLSAFNTDTDRTTVWIHKQDRLVARFGNKAYEVMSPTFPERLLEFERVESAQSWLDFKAKVAAAHGFEVGEGLTPLRFHQELGLSFGYAPEDSIFEVPLAAVTKFLCPSSDDLRLISGLRKGGSGSSGFKAMRLAGGAASVLSGWSGA